jgi:hypothetical protein
LPISDTHLSHIASPAATAGILKSKTPRWQNQRGVSDKGEELSASGRNFHLGANMHPDLGGIVIDEVTHLVEWDAPEFRPLPQSAD